MVPFNVWLPLPLTYVQDLLSSLSPVVSRHIFFKLAFSNVTYSVFQWRDFQEIKYIQSRFLKIVPMGQQCCSKDRKKIIFRSAKETWKVKIKYLEWNYRPKYLKNLAIGNRNYCLLIAWLPTAWSAFYFLECLLLECKGCYINRNILFWLTKCIYGSTPFIDSVYSE